MTIRNGNKRAKPSSCVNEGGENTFWHWDEAWLYSRGVIESCISLFCVDVRLLRHITGSHCVMWTAGTVKLSQTLVPEICVAKKNDCCSWTVRGLQRRTRYECSPRGSCVFRVTNSFKRDSQAEREIQGSQMKPK